MNMYNFIFYLDNKIKFLTLLFISPVLNGGSNATLLGRHVMISVLTSSPDTNTENSSLMKSIYIFPILNNRQNIGE